MTLVSLRSFFLLIFIFLFTSLSYSQTFVPFAFWRKKTAWTPTDLSTGLIGWYDTSDPVTIRTGIAGISQASNTDPVSQWQDKSGNAYHADQSVAGRQPTYNATTWTGGLPTITWNSADNGLVITGLTLQQYSYAMVIRHNTLGGVRALLTKRAAVSANFFWFIWDSTSGTINWDQNGNRFNTGFTPAAATDYVYTLVRPLTGTSRSQYVNGTLSGTTATNPDDNNANTIIIGNDYSASNRAAASSISELIIVSNSVSGPIRETIEGYLAWKWNTVSSLPVTHPYRTVPP